MHNFIAIKGIRKMKRYIKNIYYTQMKMRKLGLMMAPEASRSAVEPTFISSRDTGTEVGYTSKLKAPEPV